MTALAFCVVHTHGRHRAIYYQNPDLFGSQKYVDGLVDEIAFTFGVGRNALNIVS